MKKTRKAELLLVTATMLAGFGWVFSKQSIHEMPPFMFIGLRFIMASTLLLPFCYSTLKKLSILDVGKASSVGLLQGVALLLWIYSVSITDALGEGAFIMSLSMLFVPLLAWLIFHQKPGNSFWVSLPIAILGLYTLSSTGEWTLSGSQFYFLLSALTLALQFNLNSKFSKSIPTIPLTCIQFFFTGLIALIFSILTETWPKSFETMTWIWFLASVIPATCFRFLVQISGQKKTSAANAAVIMILEPLWTVLLSVVIYSEVMSLNKVTGCFFIISALVIYKFCDRILIKFNKRLLK